LSIRIKTCDSIGKPGPESSRINAFPLRENAVDPSWKSCSPSTQTVELLTAAGTVSHADRNLIEEELVHRFQPMIRRIANSYHGRGAEMDDLLQVAHLALINAIRGFKDERGYFGAYAKATIAGEMKRHLRDHCWAIRPPRRVQDLRAQIGQSTAELVQQNGSSPALSALAEYMDATVLDIAEAMTARSCYIPTPLDRPFGLDGRTLAEILSTVEDPYEELLAHVTLIQICADVSDEDRQLIRLRYYECLSQREIAKELGVSQMHVSRMLGHLIERLRSRAVDSMVA
jgi:RNA polymerase sigma-B factor